MHIFLGVLATIGFLLGIWIVYSYIWTKVFWIVVGMLAAATILIGGPIYLGIWLWSLSAGHPHHQAQAHQVQSHPVQSHQLPSYEPPKPSPAPGSIAELNAHMATYVAGWTRDYWAAAETDSNLSVSQTGAVTTHLVGPVVVVNPIKRDVIADIQSRLPGYLHPKNAEAVQVVVWDDHYTRVTGHYSPGGGNVYTWYADQVFVDARTHKVLGTTELVGGPPPQMLINATEGWGDDIPNSRIAQSITDWVNSTPHSG